MLALTGAVILRSKSRGTHDILLSQIRDFPNLEASPVFVFMSLRNRVAQLYPQALGFLFITSYDLQGYSGGMRSRFHTGETPESIQERIL
jgi:hypothetical protein